jgi:formylmethanofuran dehydrogenase subunit B
MHERSRVTCPFCSLQCTDLRLSFDGGRLSGFTPGCALGESGFRRALADRSAKQPSRASQKTSLQTARTWLRESRQPLVVLSGVVDGEAVPAALRLAKQVSAILACDEDLTGSLLGLSMQATGLLTGTLGDLRNLSLVVLCGVDPDKTHPRLGDFLCRDQASRTLRLEPLDLLESLRWLRLAGSVAGESIPPGYAQISARIQAAPSGLVVFGSKGLIASQPLTTELLLWLRDLNREKPWYALYLAPSPNCVGMVESLLSLTGVPGNLRFGPQGVDYSPQLWRAEHLIQQGGTDLCLLVGQPGSFSEKTLSLLAARRTILLDPQPPDWNPAVWLPSARVGVEVAGHFQRLDGVPVELHALLPGRRPSMGTLLSELAAEGQQA